MYVIDLKGRKVVAQWAPPFFLFPIVIEDPKAPVLRRSIETVALARINQDVPDRAAHLEGALGFPAIFETTTLEERGACNQRNRTEAAEMSTPETHRLPCDLFLALPRGERLTGCMARLCRTIRRL